MEMTKFHRYISAKVTNEDASPSKIDKLERKEFKKLLKASIPYGYSINSNLNKLYRQLNIQETIIFNMRFFDESTIEEVISWEGISEKEVRSAELKALKF